MAVLNASADEPRLLTLPQAILIAEQIRDLHSDDAGASLILIDCLANVSTSTAAERVYALLVLMEITDRHGERAQYEKFYNEMKSESLQPLERESLERWLSSPSFQPISRCSAG